MVAKSRKKKQQTYLRLPPVVLYTANSVTEGGTAKQQPAAVQCSAVTEGLREVRSDRRVGNACAPASATSETNDVICWTMITQAHGLHGMGHGWIAAARPWASHDAAAAVLPVLCAL